MMALPVTLAGVILAKPLSNVILGPSFAAASNLVRLNMINVAAVALAIYCGNRLITHKREKPYLSAVFAGALLRVMINMLLIGQYGAVVAFISTIISQFGVAFTANVLCARPGPA